MKLPVIFWMKYTSGLSSVSNMIYQLNWCRNDIFSIITAIARVALDVRLGCLDDDAPIETQELIDAVNIFFKNVGVLELKVPFWRLFSTPTWRKYVNALDTIVEWVNVALNWPHTMWSWFLFTIRITSKHTNVALERAKGKEIDGGDKKEPSLLQRLISLDTDAKIATILALDLFLVGIDTVSFIRAPAFSIVASFVHVNHVSEWRSKHLNT